MRRLMNVPLSALKAPATRSLLLRLASLAGKFALTLYMARMLSLTELGRYGLAFAAAMIAVVAFGFRLEHVVTRDVARQDSVRRRQLCTAVTCVYLVSFILAAPAGIYLLVRLGGPDSGGVGFAALVYALCCAESYANFVSTVTSALRRPVLADALFLVRAGLWTVPAVAMSFAVAELRNAEFILACWLAGVLASLAVNVWVLRKDLLRGKGEPGLAWADLASLVRRSAPVWAGSACIMLGTWLDRFVLASMLTLEEVGIATFFSSFTFAAIHLVQSATTNHRFPSLIDHYDARRQLDCRREFSETARRAAVLTTAILATLAIGMPFLAEALGKPKLVEAYPVFLLLLVAAWLRSHAETLYWALFIGRHDAAIWSGNLVYMVTSFVSSLLFIGTYGFPGLGLAAIVSAIVLASWRAYHVRGFPRLDLRPHA